MTEPEKAAPAEDAKASEGSSAVDDAKAVAALGRLVNVQIIPTGARVSQAEAPELGEVVVLDLAIPGGAVEVILAPELAEKVGGNLNVAGRRAKLGLASADSSDLRRLKQRRADGAKRPSTKRR